MSSSSSQRVNLRRTVLSSFIGNFIEWFDYAMYGYFAAILATVFFTESDPQVGLILTFGLFAISFLVRPIGAIAWGHIGDRFGRKVTLSWSIILMSLATTGIAILPTYEQRGLLAPLLLLLCRVIQGFSAAGEYAGAGTLLTENAPPHRRGFIAAVIPASTATGLLCGSLLATMLTVILSEESLYAWGWRLPFLLAAPLGLIGIWIRRHMDESEEFISAKKTSAAPLKAIWAESRSLLIAFSACLLNAVGFYVILSYLPIYLSEELEQNTTEAFIAASITLSIYIFSVLFTGWLSDKLGRRRIMLSASVTFFFITVPAFLLLQQGGFAKVVMVQLLLGLVLALNDGVLPSFLSEQFSTPVRLSGFALTFNTANAVFGGTAPMISTVLISCTGSTVAPAFYLMCAAAVTFVAVRSMPGRQSTDYLRTNERIKQ